MCCHRPWSTLFQVIACRLFVTKPLPAPMPTYCQFETLTKFYDEPWSGLAGYFQHAWEVIRGSWRLMISIICLECWRLLNTQTEYMCFKWSPFRRWVGVGGFSKVVATFNHVGESSFIFLWPPRSHLFEFGFMCCMLSTFHVSSRIVANISGPSLLFSITLEALLEENITRKLLTLSLDLFFKMLLFQVTFRILFLLLSFLLTFFWLVSYCSMWLHFSPGN